MFWNQVPQFDSRFPLKKTAKFQCFSARSDDRRAFGSVMRAACARTAPGLAKLELVCFRLTGYDISPIHRSRRGESSVPLMGTWSGSAD